MRVHRLCLLGLLTLLAASAYAQSAGTHAGWLKHREALRGNADVLGYYTFEDVTQAAPTTKNLRPADHPLSFALVPAADVAPQKLELVPGRWPEKQAVRLDMGRLEGAPFEVTSKSFSASCWVRKLGPGTHRGNSGATNGTILSTGIGYWDGWRLTTSYPQMSLGFEIGRPQPQSSFGINAGPSPDNVWQHLCATWDGRETRLYANGLLIAKGSYAGDYTPPPGDKRFRIGFAGYGFGSVVLDVDEVVVWNRALTPAEVLAEAYFDPAPSQPITQAVLAAEEAFSRKEYPVAEKAYATLAKQADLGEGLKSLALLRLAETAAAQQQLGRAVEYAVGLSKLPGAPEANKQAAQMLLLRLARGGAGSLIPLQVYQAMLTTPGMTPTDKLNAHLQIGHSLRRAGKSAEAREEYAKAWQVEGLTPQQVTSARLTLAHALRAEKDYAGARATYSQLTTEPQAPPIVVVDALFGVAASYAAEKKLPAARAEYEKVIAMEAAPEHLRQEARERLEELDGRPLPSLRMTIPPQPKPAITLYVAPNGKDTNVGTIEQPFATLTRARDAIRAARKDGKLPDGGAKVYLRGGDYPVTQTFELFAEDAGTEQAPVVYRAYREEKPRLLGLRQVKGLTAVSDAAILARLPEEARGKVLQVDLKANGISDLGTMAARGYGLPSGPYAEIYWNGRPLPLAKFPNKGWLRIGEVSGGKDGQPWSFAYDTERAARWTKAPDLFLRGLWYWDWAEGTVPARLDAAAGRFTITQSPGYGIRANQRYLALNLLEEIDQPGEWYLDRDSGILYVYPPSAPAQAQVEFSAFDGPFARLDGCPWTTFQGITFDGARGDGIVVKNGNHNVLAACTITRCGVYGCLISGPDSGLIGCDLSVLGSGGINMSAGDRKTLTPGNSFVENCHIYDFSRINRSYTPAVLMNGCGNRVIHNLIHESPHHAMRIEGNDHLVAYNEVHSVVTEGDDQAGVDMWGNPTYRGNRFLYNYWHHIGSGVPCGQGGIRLDDAISGVLIYGNVFYKCSESNFGGVQIHGGKENIVDNCVFADCKFGISFSGWGKGRWDTFLKGHEAQLYKDIDITKPPYSTKYPDLARITEDEGVNMVWRNVAYRCGEFLTRDRGIQQVVDNFVTAEDPGFVNADKGDFDLKVNATVLSESNFRPIPFGEIGLYKDELRASWPVKNEVSPNYQPEKRGE